MIYLLSFITIVVTVFCLIHGKVRNKLTELSKISHYKNERYIALQCNLYFHKNYKKWVVGLVTIDDEFKPSEAFKVGDEFIGVDTEDEAWNKYIKYRESLMVTKETEE